MAATARLLALALIALASAAPAMAQDARASRAPPSRDAAVAQLAEILGRSHYLRVLCAGSADQTWRAAMLRMLQIEAPAGPKRADLARRFNDGFRLEEETFARCTPAAEAQARAHARDGKRLSDAIAAPSRAQ